MLVEKYVLRLPESVPGGGQVGVLGVEERALLQQLRAQLLLGQQRALAPHGARDQLLAQPQRLLLQLLRERATDATLPCQPFPRFEPTSGGTYRDIVG